MLIIILTVYEKFCIFVLIRWQVNIKSAFDEDEDDANELVMIITIRTTFRTVNTNGIINSIINQSITNKNDIKSNIKNDIDNDNKNDEQ